MISTVRFGGRRARHQQLYRVAVRVEAQGGEWRWETVSEPMTHAKALQLGSQHERVGRRARLEDFVPGKEATAAVTSGAPVAQLELTK